MLKRSELKGTWNLNKPIGILAVYFFGLFPALHLFLPQAQKWASGIYPAYFGFVLLLLILNRSATWRQLGFHKEHWKQNLVLGGLAGGIVLGLLPLLDFLIRVSGLDQTPLFAGAEARFAQESLNDTSFIFFLIPSLFFAGVEQGFLTGYVFQALVRKLRPALAVYLGGLLFTLIHFDLQLGQFLLGLSATMLYWLTGSLVAPWILQVACHTAGWLLIHHYPALLTLLGFLF